MDLTDPQMWDAYWGGTTLPAIATRARSASTDAVLDALDALDITPTASVLEVGGAPAQYLAYVQRSTGCRVTVLDSSPEGCRLARANLELLGVPGRVVEGDVREPLDERFDVVYSLGLVEHFDDLDAIVRAHLEHVRPGGQLLLGCPNFGGALRRPLAWLRPEMFGTNNLATMKLERWKVLDRALPVRRERLGYVGGLDLRTLSVCEVRTPLRRALTLTARGAARVLGTRGAGLIARGGSARWSSYLIAVYRAEEQP